MLKKIMKSIIIITTITITSYLILSFIKNGYFGGHDTICYKFLSLGVLRSIAGIGLGCCIGYLYQKYINLWNTKSLNLLSTTLISILEILGLAYISWWYFYPHKFIYHIVFVFVFTILLLLFLYNKGFISKFLNNKIWSIISKYSFSIFVTHYIIIKILYNYYWRTHKEFVALHPIFPIVIDILAVITIGFATYHLIEKPSFEFLTNLNTKKGNKNV